MYFQYLKWIFWIYHKARLSLGFSSKEICSAWITVLVWWEKNHFPLQIYLECYHQSCTPYDMVPISAFISGPLSITEQQQAGNPCVYYGNTSIHPEVFSFHAEFLDKFNVMEKYFCSCSGNIKCILYQSMRGWIKYRIHFCPEFFHILSIYSFNIFVCQVIGLTKLVRPINNGWLSRL